MLFRPEPLYCCLLYLGVSVENRKNASHSKHLQAGNQSRILCNRVACPLKEASSQNCGLGFSSESLVSLCCRIQMSVIYCVCAFPKLSIQMWPAEGDQMFRFTRDNPSFEPRVPCLGRVQQPHWFVLVLHKPFPDPFFPLFFILSTTRYTQ